MATHAVKMNNTDKMGRETGDNVQERVLGEAVPARANDHTRLLRIDTLVKVALKGVHHGLQENVIPACHGDTAACDGEGKYTRALMESVRPPEEESHAFH